MIDTGDAELDVLRQEITDAQRAILDEVWEYFRDKKRWITQRILDQRFGKPAVQSCLAQFGDNVIRTTEDDGEECYRLTFLGVLLSSQGEESEQILARYLEYVRRRCKSDPGLEWMTSQEVEAALGLTTVGSRLLRQLIRLSHWWGEATDMETASGPWASRWMWTYLPSVPDLRSYIREHVLTHFPLRAPAGERERPRSEFWFVSNPDLERRLTMDWREAQDVYQVRGWKSCLVLCGGVLEALLLDALLCKGHAPSESVRSRLGVTIFSTSIVRPRVRPAAFA